MIVNNEECMEWLHETRTIFPKLDNKIILTEYRKMSNKKLGYVSAKIEQKLDFNPESLLLGEPTIMRRKIKKPQEFKVYINQKLQDIENSALRKEIVQHILIHELLHIELDDLVSLSKQYKRRKRKKIHTREFEEEIFRRFNILREKKGITKIEKIKHLEIAIHKILDSINWFEK